MAQTIQISEAMYSRIECGEKKTPPKFDTVCDYLNAYIQEFRTLHLKGGNKKLGIVKLRNY